MKPVKLIDLLEQLLAETEKMNVGKKYIAAAEETNRITFADPQSELVYKHLIRLSMKDFIHSGRSAASVSVIRDVIGIISEAEITA